MDSKEDIEGKEDLLCSLDKDVGVTANSGVVFSASKLKLVLEMATQERSLTSDVNSSDVKQARTNQRCILESNLQNRCGRECWSPKLTGFVSLNENLVRRCLDLVEVKASDSLNMICRTLPFNVPANLGSSKMEFLFSSLKPHRRRSRSTSDLSKFAIESAVAAGPENIIIGPVGRWAIDRIEGNNKVINLRKNPLVRHLGAIDSNVSLGREKLVGVNDTKCLKSINSPSMRSISSPQRRVADTTTRGRQRYGSDCSDKLFISSPSSSSASSYQSTPSAGGATSVGLLHCKWKSGLPYFVFSMDDRGEVYAANPCKVESSSGKDLDYMYLFHLRTDSKRNQGSSVDDASNLVGKMKVSNSLSLSSNNLQLAETEFVLFGFNQTEEMQSSSHAKKSTNLPKKVVDVFWANYSSKQKHTPIFGNASPKSKCISHAPDMGVSGNLDDMVKENHDDNHLPPNLELAAIIVKDHFHDSSWKQAIGGWGLKFLQKAEVKHEDASLGSESCQGRNSGNGGESTKRLNVLVPAGFHGGPRTRSGGPSSLTARWKSGGRCDCGGWDVGCPLTVLNDRSNNTGSSPNLEAHERSDLFIEGAEKQGVPTLKMVNVHEGLYFIHFQSILSPLQSFSIGVAIIHSRSPSLCPHVYRN